MKLILSERLKQILINFFSEERISLSEKTAFAVCFSGGRDSTSLLKLMRELSEEKPFLLKAVYIRHNLRPVEECNIEETHVRHFCLSEKIPLSVETIPEGFIRHIAGRDNRSLEEAARTERYRIFETLHRRGFADWFLTAHHRDDNFETIVSRFFEGAGVSGLKGIPPQNRFYLRPLLTVPPGLLTEYLSEKQISWIEDSSNTDLSVLRNRYRHLILPFLRKEISGCDAGLNRVIRKMKEADEILSKNIPFPLTVDGESVLIDRQKWEECDEYVKTESLRRAIQLLLDKEENKRISYDFLSELKKAGCGEKLYRGIRVRVDRSVLRFSRTGECCLKTDFCINISRPGMYPFAGGTLTVEESDKISESAVFAVAADEVRLPVFFRSLRYGDDRSGLTLSSGRLPVPDACIGDRSGLLAVFENGTGLTKKTATLEKIRFFNYYISSKE